MWVKHTADHIMPEWVLSALNPTCEFCGTEKENFYNAKGACTARRCPNPLCSETLAQRIKGMATVLGLSGIGAKTGAKLSVYCKVNHFDVIPKWFDKDEKPTITLAMLMRMCYIQGIDSEWESVCAPYGSVGEMYGDYKGPKKAFVAEAYEIAKYGEQFFTIAQPTFYEYEPLIKGRVMLTGPIPGLSHHNVFIHGMRQQTQGLISFDISENARKTGISYLITNDKNGSSKKLNVAREEGIPIYTPEEFTALMAEKLEKEIAERGITRREEKKNAST